MEDFFATLTPWWPPGREDLHWHLLPQPRVAATSDEPLRRWLAAHPARTVTFTATQLSLVAQPHDGSGAITWRPLAAVPLRRPGTAAP
jgi:hypothetical protein